MSETMMARMSGIDWGTDLIGQLVLIVIVLGLLALTRHMSDRK
jgi:hypothetical protein